MITLTLLMHLPPGFCLSVWKLPLGIRIWEIQIKKLAGNGVFLKFNETKTPSPRL